jgi:hypothetical protein
MSSDQVEPRQRSTAQAHHNIIKAEKDCPSILWKLQRLYTRIHVSSREEEVESTFASLLFNSPMEKEHDHAQGIAIKIVCISLRRKMKWKSQKLTTYFIIITYNTLASRSLNPKIQKIIVLII